jgi:hypothetical protein
VRSKITELFIMQFSASSNFLFLWPNIFLNIRISNAT